MHTPRRVRRPEEQDRRLGLAISFDPLVSGLAKRGLPRALATAIVAVGVITGVVIFLVLFGGALASQATALVLSVPFLIVDVVSWLNGTFDARIDPAEITSNLNLTTQQLADLAGSLAGGLLGVIANVFGAIFSFVTILVFSFYFSASAPQIKRFLASWLKPERQVVFIEVWDISVRKAGGSHRRHEHRTSPPATFPGRQFLYISPARRWLRRSPSWPRSELR